MLLHYLKMTFRDFRKHKIQTATCIVGISIGLACFTFCAYYARLFTGMDTHYPDADRIFTVVRENHAFNVKHPINRIGLSRYLYQYPEIAATAEFNFAEPISTTVSRESGTEYFFNLSCIEVENTWFDFFSVKPIEGVIDNRLGAIVLTQQAAQKLFPGESAVGKLIEGNQKYLDNLRPVFYTVTAVIPDIPRKSFFNAYAYPYMLDCLLIWSLPAGVGVWLEEFTYQVSLPFWLFFPVFALPAAGLIVTVLHHLVHVARQNPAEVVNSG